MRKEQALERLASIEKEATELREYILEAVEDEKTIIEKVDSFEAACKITNINPSIVPLNERILVIHRALIEDWVVDFSNSSQTKYSARMRYTASGFVYYDFGYYGSPAGVSARLCCPTLEILKHLASFKKEYTDYLLANSEELIEKYKF